MITGIKHIAIAVRDVDAVLRKYEAVLGVQGATRHRFERARTD
jgi:catechol 2,3-dioxygenase-like lactoylglutathione lyase family enzyme